MKYYNDAMDISEELAEVLFYNKYLLDDIELLKIVIYNRMLTGMGSAYRDGFDRPRIAYSDLSHLTLNINQGAN